MKLVVARPRCWGSLTSMPVENDETHKHSYTRTKKEIQAQISLFFLLNAFFIFIPHILLFVELKKFLQDYIADNSLCMLLMLFCDKNSLVWACSQS